MIVLLRKIRKEKNLTQFSVADMANIGRSTISDIETGRRVPGVDIALHIARALDCKVEDIFKLEE